MTFLASVVLVCLAAVFALAGTNSDSSTPFLASAFLSGIAVFLIWRRTVASREKLDFPGAPPVSNPDWSRPLRGEDRLRDVDDADAPEDLTDATALGIARFDELLASEILPRLETLSVEQLRAVISHEKSGLARDAIIRRAERLIELTLNGPGVDLRPEPVIPGRSAPQQSLDRGRDMRKSGPDLSI